MEQMPLLPLKILKLFCVPGITDPGQETGTLTGRLIREMNGTGLPS